MSEIELRAEWERLRQQLRVTDDKQRCCEIDRELYRIACLLKRMTWNEQDDEDVRVFWQGAFA